MTFADFCCNYEIQSIALLLNGKYKLVDPHFNNIAIYIDLI